MRSSLRGAVVAGLAALGLLATATPPAHAASGFDRCPSGRFCLFDNRDGTGAMVSFTTSAASLGTFDNKAQSARNRTGKYVNIYTQQSYREGDPTRNDATLFIEPDGAREGIDLTYVDKMSNNVSSVRIASTEHEVMTGLPYMPWYSPSTYGQPRAAQPVGDLNRDGVTDLLFRTLTGALYFQRGDGSATSIGVGWNSMNVLQRHGDRDGDGAEDIVTRDGNGVLWMYPGNGMGGLKPRVQIGVGWSTLRNITAVGDFNGDGRRGDVVTNDSSGRLWLFAGRSNGTLEPRKQIGSSGWQGMTALVGAGDMNSDGKNDLVARDGSGRLWLYPGKGNGAMGPRQQIGVGWKTFGRIFGLGDVNADGRRGDLFALHAPYLSLYTNNGLSRLSASYTDYGWDTRETAF